MASRAELKSESLRRIVDAAATRLRTEGLGGTAIADVMRDAGLTHGAFYVHFSGKRELAIAGLRHALSDNRRRWIAGTRQGSWPQRLQSLARRYLTKIHRDEPADGCALAAIATEAGRADATFRTAYEDELRTSLRRICCGDDPNAVPKDRDLDDAITLMALCVGGLLLARAVKQEAFSDRILQACVDATERIAPPTEDSEINDRTPA